jgi:hypothetical protein
VPKGVFLVVVVVVVVVAAADVDAVGCSVNRLSKARFVGVRLGCIC